jgi:murein tripeptide amidase MpaA
MVLQRLLLTLVVVLVLAIPGAPSHASDSEVVRVYEVPRTELARLRYLGDFWGLNWREDYVSLYVTPRGRAAIEALGYRVETDHEKQAELERFVAIDRAEWRAQGRSGIPGFPCYRTVAETHAAMAALAADFPALARLEDIGDSWRKANAQPGGDDILSLVVANQASPHPQAPLVVMAAQHARELATAESALRFAEWLVLGYDSDPTARWLLDHREIHIIAVQNPDGRREVEDTEPFWRKNANTNFCPGSLPGVDLNRNSPIYFGSASSGNACSEIYRGPSASSEPETTAIEDYLVSVFTDYRENMTDFIPDTAEGIFHSIHSFGEQILFPWEGSGFGVSNDAPNHDQLTWLGRKLGFFTDYEVGRQILGPAGGTTVDFAHGELGIAAFTYEIGTSFQQSCSSFESTIWPRVRDSLIYSAKAAARPYAAPAGPEVTALNAFFDDSTGQILIEGLADDTRFDRNGASEPPFSDPISPINSVVASLDLPPELAQETFTLTLDANATVTGFAGIAAVGTLDLDTPRLLFTQATDSAGQTGVPSATWIQAAAVFGDRFEEQP